MIGSRANRPRDDDARQGCGAGPLASRLTDFRRDLQLTGDGRHATRTVQIVRAFLWQSRIRTAADLTAGGVANYLGRLADAGRAVKTLANHRYAISRFARYLRASGLPIGEPCREVRLRRPQRPPPRYLDDGEIAETLRLARHLGIWPEVALALATGLRRSELIRLEWADVDLNRRSLLVRRSKSRRPRTVPLSRAAILALRVQRRRTGRLTQIFPARRTWPGCWSYVDRPREASWWVRALRPIQEGVPKFRTLPGCSTGRGWHLLRHTFASRAAQAGVSLYKLALWLGHSDIRTTQIYAHLQAGYDPDIERGDPPGKQRRPGPGKIS